MSDEEESEALSVNLCSSIISLLDNYIRMISKTFKYLFLADGGPQFLVSSEEADKSLLEALDFSFRTKTYC
jgi:hypothetical protein